MHLSKTFPTVVSDRESDAWILGKSIVRASNAERKSSCSLPTGLKEFDSKGNVALEKELVQLHDMNMFHPIFLRSHGGSTTGSHPFTCPSHQRR